MRKAAARRLAEAGCSASEIAAITGHKTLAEVERYTRAADQERLARQAIRKQVETRSGKLPGYELANSDDASLEINSLIAGLALPREVPQAFSDNDLCRLPTPYWLDPMPGVSGAVTNASTVLTSPQRRAGPG